MNAYVSPKRVSREQIVLYIFESENRIPTSWQNLCFVLSITDSWWTNSQGVLGEAGNNRIDRQDCKPSVEITINPKKNRSITGDSGDKIREPVLYTEDCNHQHFDCSKTPNIRRPSSNMFLLGPEESLGNSAVDQNK